MFWLKVACAVIIMASTPIWIRLTDASTLAIGIVRLSFGVTLTAGVFFPRVEFSRLWGKTPLEKSATLPRWLLPAIGILFGLHWYTYFESIQRSSASLAILALSTYGIHVTWIGALVTRSFPSLRDWAAIALSAIGAWLCLPSLEGEAVAFGGFLFGLLSAILYAILPMLHKQAAHLSLPTRGTAQFFFAWLIFLPFAPFQEWDLQAKDWLFLTILGIFSTFIAHNLWISITTKLPPSQSGLLNYLALPITMVLETFLLGNTPKKLQWVGALLIVTGNAYTLWRQSGKTKAGSNPRK